MPNSYFSEYRSWNIVGDMQGDNTFAAVKLNVSAANPLAWVCLNNRFDKPANKTNICLYKH
jgi:hypothetical protein